jgi:hypothetical protein
MEEEPQSEDEVTYKGMALYDPVRFQYFKRFEDALNYYQKCLTELAAGYVPKDTVTFVSKVCALYLELQPKLEYSTVKYKERLKTIEKYMLTGNFRSGNELSELDFPLDKVQKQNERNIIALFLEFTTYFFDLRNFIEANGITHYENAKYSLRKQIIEARTK